VETTPRRNKARGRKCTRVTALVMAIRGFPVNHASPSYHGWELRLTVGLG